MSSGLEYVKVLLSGDWTIQSRHTPGNRCKARRRINLAHAQGDQIVQNRARSTRLASDAHHIVHREIRLDRNLLPGGIDLKVPVQAKITHKGDPQVFVFANNFA
jgi:hypothetical protein